MDAKTRYTFYRLSPWGSNVQRNHQNYLQNENVCFTLSTRPSQHNRPKKCPYLRTYLWRIISALWTRGDFPTLWKRGITVLAYKNDSNKGPSNFRLITLQPVLSKVFTSILRNRIYDFSYKNKCIESNLQKGFWDDISGCIEHIETLTHINHARKKQRSLIVTLLDLKNALGEVNHDLLLSVLKYQKVLERNLGTWILRHSGTLFIKLCAYRRKTQN